MKKKGGGIPVGYCIGGSGKYNCSQLGWCSCNFNTGACDGVFVAGEKYSIFK